MKQLLIIAATFATLTSCHNPNNTVYTTTVFYQTRGTANWVDTNYRSQWIGKPNKYNVGDTLRGIDRDQVIISKVKID